MRAVTEMWQAPRRARLEQRDRRLLSLGCDACSCWTNPRSFVAPPVRAAGVSPRSHRGYDRLVVGSGGQGDDRTGILVDAVGWGLIAW